MVSTSARHLQPLPHPLLTEANVLDCQEGQTFVSPGNDDVVWLPSSTSSVKAPVRPYTSPPPCIPMGGAA